MAIIRRGQEPANIKKRLDTLFPKLNEAYPDKVIRSLAKDHKKWAETVTELYRALGYPDSESFLKAYGYTVERGSQGRPSGDYTSIIDELKKRYPNGAPFEKMGELQAANPDLAGKFKTLSNRAKELFGMTLADYFKSIGLLGGSDHKKQLDDLIAELKCRYPEGSVLPATLAQLKEDNADLMTSRLVYIKEVYGVNPQEYLTKAGLMQSDDPVSQFNSFINELRSRYKGKLFPGTIEQYEEENSDLSWSAAKIWVKSAHQITLRAFFKSNDMLGPIITDASQYLVLSEDNKTVTDFNPTCGKGERIVKIPAGVEVIQDKAFLYHRFDHLYVPKELKTFGKYTLKNINGQPIRIKFVEVEKGNPYFYTDGAALYRKDGSKDTLMYVFDHTLSSYTFPEGVSSVDPEAFAYCETLSNLTLSEGMETFDEKALPYGTKIRNIHIPAGLKHLIVSPSRTCDSWNSSSNRIQYTIDENNEYLFRDEDSIYEVLEDGSLKLVINMYLGKGRALIRDDTAEIGEQAFFAHKNLSEVELPMSVRCIHAEAFSRCENLKKAIIPSSVSVIAEDAFAHCYYLNSTEANQSSDQLSVKLADMKTELSAKFANREHISPKTTTNLTTEEAVVEAEKSKNSADTSICNITPRPDAFTQFANIFTSSIEELSLSDAAYKDGAIFDKEKKSVSITVPISQYTHDEALLNEYIACAETIQPGNSLRVQVGRYRWDLYSQSGKALGYVSTDFWDITNYLNILTIQNCTVAEVTPKSARRKNAKYALVSVTLEISERTPAESLTQEDAEARKLFAYYVDQTGVQLVHWLGRSLEKKITIPATIEGLPVTTICSDVFRLPTCNLCVGEIVFPEGIKRLSASVLYQLENLKKIVFPASLEYISPNIFASSTGDNKDLYLSAKTIYVAPQDSYADKFLKAYTPDSFDVSILTVVNDTLESKPIDTKLLSTLRIERADQELLVGFKSEWEIADAPQNIDIPETINGEKVKIFSLYGIPNTTEVLTIPSTVIDLRDMTESTLFYGSGKNLHTIGIAADNEHYWSDGFSIFSKDRKTLLRFMSFTSTAYSVPDGTETIGKNAFNSMENLRTITLPNSISKIGDFAFSGCSQLEIISNIEAVPEIGKQILGLNVPYVQKKSVLQIGSSLLKYENTNEKIIKIPEGITKICAYALSGERGDVAEEIVLPSSLLVIEENAFYGRKQLEKINIPEGVQAIPRGAFCGCEKLKTISIPASVSEINTDAFPVGYSFGAQSCSFALINVDCKNQHYCSIDGMLLSKDCIKLLFVPNCLQSTTLRIPDGVEIICENAAYGNSNLTKVIMPNSVTTVDEGAFMHCENLTCVTISSNVERINSHAFEDTAITEIPLPENLRHIGTQAFSNTQAKRVMLPKSVRTLGWGAFSGVNEIEVYDSIDPEAKMAHEGIDDCNGYPNSLVGYIGIGPAWAMWECAANHRWNDYTITVRANDTNEIKYKVWMGADESQRDYYCFLASAWGRNATFAFKQLDCYFPKIRNKYHKRMVAQYRLEYPYKLSEASRKRYETFLAEIKKGGGNNVPVCIQNSY